MATRRRRRKRLGRANGNRWGHGRKGRKGNRVRQTGHVARECPPKGKERGNQRDHLEEKEIGRAERPTKETQREEKKEKDTGKQVEERPRGLEVVGDAGEIAFRISVPQQAKERGQFRKDPVGRLTRGAKGLRK